MKTRWMTKRSAAAGGLVFRLAIVLLPLMATDTTAVTNTVPWSESFEPYPSGMALSGTNGWTAQQWNAGLVTNDATRVSLLPGYLTGIRTYPLPTATHTNILALSAEVVNRVQSDTGGVVAVEFMALPTRSDTVPDSQTNDQCALYIATNGLLTIWHYNRSVSPATNEWLMLTNSPVISTSEWSRFTVLMDYSNSMFQVRINQDAPLTDGVGWQRGGLVQGGDWFFMVQTNRALSALAAEASPAYLDDVVATRRELTFSHSNFTESVTNNGGITPTPLVISLTSDSFAGAQGSDLVADGKLIVGNLPSNLVAVATLVDSTNVSVVLTNIALQHEAADSLGNLSLRFADAAFVLGRASDVLGFQVTNLVVAFSNTPSLGYSRLAFTEAAANDGSIDNTSPLILTLTNAVFAGTLGEDLALDSAKLQVPLLPAGLSVQAIQTNSTQVVVRLMGQALSHGVADNLTTLQLQFQAGAFILGGAPVSSVLGLSPYLSITFLPPATLAYGSTAFSEAVQNDGTVIQTTSLTLDNKQFDAVEGEDMAQGGKVTWNNLPPGLVLHVVRGADAGTATLSFGGAATHHEASDSVADFGITLTDAAVVGGNAAAIANSARTDLSITFTDARILSYSRKTFEERSAGLIDNRYPPTISLAGDTFAGVNGDDFVASGRIVVTGLPSGLSAQVTRETATRLAVRLLGTASSHASGDSVTGGTFTFQNSAFALGNALYVNDYQVADIAVTFNDLAGIVNLLPFEDSFEPYVLGLQVSGVNGWLGDFADDAGIVTNDPVLLAKLPATCERWGYEYPISGTHTQILFVQNNLYNEVHSQSATNVVVDFLTIPVAVTGDPESDTNDQCAVYVSTNGQLVVWQHDPRMPTNRWITLSGSPVISTSQWTRLTVECNYTNQMFRIRVNEGDPLIDPLGWTLGGAATGTWFHMVQTNGTMSRFRVTGDGVGYLEDFTVRTELPSDFGYPHGVIYTIR